MKTLAVVPARGGSKGLPGKNALPFLGESLLGRAIRIGLETCDRTVVTTEDPELAQIAMAYEPAIVHIRPPSLAQDDTPMLPVVQEAIRRLAGDVIVLLQPTQPLRTADQVRQAIGKVFFADSVVSVLRVPEAYSPDRIFHLDCEVDRLVPATGMDCTRRQVARQGYVRDGTVYVTWRHVLEGGSLYGSICRPLLLPGDALSIDTEEDFQRLEAIARRQIVQESLAEGMA